MATVVGGDGGFNMLDPVGFGLMLQSVATGTPSSTQWASETPGGANRWVFDGTDFGSFNNGFPTVGTITGLTFSTPGLGTLATFTGLSMSMTTFFTFVATNNLPGLIESWLSGNDNITGGNGNDNLLGYAGNDSIFGGAGNDTISGGTGIDTVDGGTGIDQLIVGRSDNANYTISTAGIGGSTFVDIGIGTQVRNFERIFIGTGGGNDLITIAHTMAGNNEINAGGGSDRLVWDMSSTVQANVSLFFSATDRGRFTASGTSSFMLDIFNFERYELTGSTGDDVLSGQSGNDTLDGWSGNDSLTGGGGDDTLRGGLGNDNLNDGPGTSTMATGTGGNDLLEGGDGNDTLTGADGNNTLSGGAGDDLIYSGSHLINGGGGLSPVDVIDGGTGTDILLFDRRTATVAFNLDISQLGSAQGVVLADGTTVRNIEAVAQVWLGSGNDVMMVTSALVTAPLPQALSLIFDGRGGDDLFIGNFSGISTSMTMFDAGLISINNRSLSIFAERLNLTGSDVNDTLRGGSGNDTLSGGQGSDRITGGDGADLLQGGAGNDTLTAGAGDTIDGGDGVDLLELNLSTTSQGITLDLRAANTLPGGIQVSNVEQINAQLGSGDDTVIVGGSSFAAAGSTQSVNAGGGNDLFTADLTGETANYTLNNFNGLSRQFPGDSPASMGLSGFERYNITGGSGDDSFTGLSGADTLNGGGGNDFLNGGGGIDQLSGGMGNDILSGNIGSTFDGGVGLDSVQVFGALSGAAINWRMSDFGTSTGVTMNGGVVRNVESIRFEGTSGNDVFNHDTLVIGQLGGFDGGAGIDRFIADFSYTTSGIFHSGNSTTFSVQDPNTFNQPGQFFAQAEEMWLTTGSGIDTLTGGQWNDWFRTGGGNDRLTGGAGNDTLEGGMGADTIDGGEGFDTLAYSSSNAGVTVNLTLTSTSNGMRQVVSGGHAAGDEVLGMEAAVGSAHNDSLFGDAIGNYLAGEGGNDLLDGRAGNDWLVGGAGGDTLVGGMGYDTAQYAAVGVNLFIRQGLGRGLSIGGAEGPDDVSGVELLYLGDGSSLMIGGAELVDRRFGDFNGDGKADIALRGVGGELAVWTMDGATVAGAATLSVPPAEWRVLGEADFDGDGRSEILWRRSDGALAQWYTNGTTLTSGPIFDTVPNEWMVQDIADYTGDGRADLMWRNSAGTVAVWAMNGTVRLGDGIVQAVGWDWRVQGSGDLNGDGRAEMLWRNETNGQILSWNVVGATLLGTTSLGVVGAEWDISAIADVGGDGRADIIWRNNVDGSVAVWQMGAGGTLQSGAVIGGADLGWSIQGAGDFNGDGRADLMWTRADGTTAFWFLNGNTVTSTAIGQNAGTWLVT